MRRLVAKALAMTIVFVLLAGAGAGVYFYLRQSLPQTSGGVSVAGLSAPVAIVRDADAIPHIFAMTRNDALFGLGYVHAQDRLWQMEFQRRIGFGRLSEVFGEATIAQDRFLRTVGFGRAARDAWATLPADARDQVNAYVAGINAFLSAHHGAALPPEFHLLGFEPEPWTGADVVVWVKMMAWDLSSNYVLELLRYDIANALGQDKLAQLMPPYPADGLSIMPAVSGGVAAELTSALTGLRGRARSAPTETLSHAFADALSAGDPTVADFLAAPNAESLGSNNWVVDGTMTASGKPLLANDPHLGTKLPSTWYLAHMSFGGSDRFDVVGGTLPGTPAVVLGRNNFIAWGATNVAADVQDLYREQLDASGRFARFRGSMEPLKIVTESIQVKGRDAVVVDVRITRHGPLVSDAINAASAAAPGPVKRAPLEPLALRWTALDPTDTTTAAILQVNVARNWDEFTASLRDFVVPSQNFVYADADGHIGYYAPGRIPTRARGDGSQPSDGASGEDEWTGWIPFEQLPHLYDPPQHFIVTANQRPAPPEYPYTLGVDWPEPYRAQRITDLLRRARGLKPDDFAAMQADTVSLHANALLPILIPLARPSTDGATQALAMVKRWDGDARGDSAGAAIFEAWFLRLAPVIAGDELGPLLLSNYASRFSVVTRFIINTLAHDAAWCDDVRTPKVETCSEAVTTALEEAVADLTRRIGSDVWHWRWDQVHRAVFPHQGLDAVAALRPFLSRSIANGGDWSTINVGPVSVDRPFEQHSVAGYREIIDLSPANDSRFIADVGQSGHPLSPHYDDFLNDWHAVKYRPMRTAKAEVEQHAAATLHLNPR